MHKLFLSDSECSFIKGSKEIVRLIGGFPSMENCKIVNISVTCLDNDIALFGSCVKCEQA